MLCHYYVGVKKECFNLFVLFIDDVQMNAGSILTYSSKQSLPEKIIYFESNCQVHVCINCWPVAWSDDESSTVIEISTFNFYNYLWIFIFDLLFNIA